MRRRHGSEEDVAYGELMQQGEVRRVMLLVCGFGTEINDVKRLERWS